jgi:REP element-mobilizing transposase RayT
MNNKPLEKNKFPFHIVTSINDSRTSKRMIQYHARERRFNGTLPYKFVIPITTEEENLIAKTVSEIVKEDNLNIAAFNICYDHMHILLVCEHDEIAKIMKKIKGRTARECNKARAHSVNGINSTGNTHSVNGINSVGKLKDGSTPFWAQKYYCKPITTLQQYDNTLNYIENNRVKHELEKNEFLKRTIENFIRTYKECFRKELKIK